MTFFINVYIKTTKGDILLRLKSEKDFWHQYNRKTGMPNEDVLREALGQRLTEVSYQGIGRVLIVDDFGHAVLHEIPSTSFMETTHPSKWKSEMLEHLIRNCSVV